MDSMTVSTAVAALARGITARSTTRSTMSALIISPPGRWKSLYLPLLQSDSVRKSRRGRIAKPADVSEVPLGKSARGGRGGEEECDGLFSNENRLDDPLVRPTTQSGRQLVVSGKRRQRTDVEIAGDARGQENGGLIPGHRKGPEGGVVDVLSGGVPARNPFRARGKDGRGRKTPDEGRQDRPGGRVQGRCSQHLVEALLRRRERLERWLFPGRLEGCELEGLGLFEGRGRRQILRFPARSAACRILPGNSLRLSRAIRLGKRGEKRGPGARRRSGRRLRSRRRFLDLRGCWSLREELRGGRRAGGSRRRRDLLQTREPFRQDRVTGHSKLAVVLFESLTDPDLRRHVRENPAARDEREPRGKNGERFRRQNGERVPGDVLAAMLEGERPAQIVFTKGAALQQKRANPPTGGVLNFEGSGELGFRDQIGPDEKMADARFQNGTDYRA